MAYIDKLLNTQDNKLFLNLVSSTNDYQWKTENDFMYFPLDLLWIRTLYFEFNKNLN